MTDPNPETTVRNGDEGDWSLGDDDTAIAYMDGVTWQHHTLCDPDGATIYGTADMLRKAHSCVEQCGIVEVEIRVRRWVQPQQIGKSP